MDLGNLLRAYGEAWTYFGNFQFVLWMMIGALAGVFIGIIPALGGTVVNAIFLAFVFMMNRDQALPFMTAVHSVGFTGGCVTTILLSIPGTSSNAATLLDGYPMMKRGEAGRALGLAITASGMGSVWSSVFALLTIPLVLPLVMAMGSPEMVFVVLMGITLIATLSRGSTLKGLISGLLGILISLIGYNLATGLERFTFGSLYLRDGLPIVPVFIGLFAIPEMIHLAAAGGSLVQEEAKVGGFKQMASGAKEVFKYLRLNVIMSLLGYFIGIIPGIGGLVASWVSYGQAKQASKRSDKFGTGIPEGIIAPESANNSTAAGSYLTTLALGIPGSEGGVILLAALLILGITPGPEMLRSNLAFSISLLLVVSISGIFAAILCLMIAPTLAKLGKVNGNVLMPLVIIIVTAGVYVSDQNMLDVVTMLVFGLIGVVFKQVGLSAAPFIVGFVLGSLFEKFLFLSIRAYGPEFFLRPIPLVLIAITIGTVLLGYRSNMFKKTKALDRDSV